MSCGMVASVCGVKDGREPVGGKVKVCGRHHASTNTKQSRYDITYIARSSCT